MKSEIIKKYAKKYAKKYKRKFPFVRITSKQFASEIQKLESLDSSMLVDKSKTRSCKSPNKFKYKGTTIFNIKQSNVGNIISNKFFEKKRMKAAVGQHPSPIDVWKDDKKRERVFAGMIKLGKSIDYNEAQLRSAIRLYYSVASQFKVSIAKVIYDYFKAKNVLDISSGWGDRLVGFLSSRYTKTYVGIDPNVSLKKLYKRLYKSYKNHSEFTGKKTKIIAKPSEDVKFPRTKKFDLIFSSPPYFELEKYSNDTNQSSNRYDNIDDWLDGYLFHTLDNHLPHLKGTLALQISDYIKNGKRIQIIKPLQKYMKIYHPNFKYKGIIKVKTKTRFATDYNCIYENIFVWNNK
jgi:16S rRNA G966 N2-methylase RsmD